MEDYDVDEILRTRIIDVDESKWKPSDKIPLITKEIEQMKAEMRTFLKDSNFDLASVLSEGRELTAESKSLLEEMEACEAEIDKETLPEILKSMDNYDMLKKELESVNFSINILEDVLRIGTLLKSLNPDGGEVQSIVKSIGIATELMKYIEHPAEGVQDLQLFDNTKTLASLFKETYIQNMSSSWDQMVKYNTKPGTEVAIVELTLTLDKTIHTLDVLDAMCKVNKLNDKVVKFAQFLYREVLIPIMRYDCVVFAETDTYMTVTITYRENYKPNYMEVIGNLRLLLHFINNRFNIEVSKKKIPLITMIGKQIGVEFTDKLIRECLLDTIPHNINDLHTYGKVTNVVEDFERFLYHIKFFHDEEFSILDYVRNIDVLFATKSSLYYFETARTIMMKDLSLSMSIGVENIPEDSDKVESKSKDQTVEQALDELHHNIPKSLFYFPRCMISKSAQELLDLLYVLMEQAVQCSDVVCRKLYLTARFIFELYDAVVPYHHENFLQNIPQYVALFHNNCMYLAHNLQTFGDKWLNLMEGRQLGYLINFVDLTPKLRELGYRHLTMHMQQQRKQILDNIRSSDLNCIVVKDVLGDNAEAAIRQCLRQLHLLKNVWIGVFPSNVFIKLMATLVNMFIDELIHRVCTVEDISMEMATQLNEMYSLVVQKVPTLFPDGTDVNEYVKSWMKLQELVFVLGGSLKDIELHWNDGTGPLAEHFTTKELRSLIKALFQNTQFRANLLSKIK
ncbi:centromere/kinetochore protein zw10 homolog [Battus philenor]|uniref:centromere/kinetochore protein zw10 homolog n=1 Tax=Battus philenor TaxID=42288 RepID=UPI0035CFE98D